MPEFHVTFGSQYGGQDYGADPHPVGGYDYVHRDGYWVVVAPTYTDARALVVAVLGSGWSDLYDASEHSTGFYPRGELLRLVHPAMAAHGVTLLEGPPPPIMRCPDNHQVDGRVLVTVYASGRGEVAWRERDDPRLPWGPPADLTPR